MSKKNLTVEDVQKALKIEIKIKPEEQRTFLDMPWDEIMKRAMEFDPTAKPSKKKGRK